MPIEAHRAASANGRATNKSIGVLRLAVTLGLGASRAGCFAVTLGLGACGLGACGLGACAGWVLAGWVLGCFCTYLRARVLRARVLQLGILRASAFYASPLPSGWGARGAAPLPQGLARAGVNAQRASRISGHASLAALNRYLQTTDMETTPEKALPPSLVVPGRGVARRGGQKTRNGSAGSRSTFRETRNDLFCSGADGTRTRGLRRDSAQDSAEIRAKRDQQSSVITPDRRGNDPWCPGAVSEPVSTLASGRSDLILRWVRQIRAALPDDPHRARALALKLERWLERAASSSKRDAG